MNKRVLTAIVKSLQEQKSSLEKEDGHKIESISVSEDYDQKGNVVLGISILYSEKVLSGNFNLLKMVESIVQETCQWYRISPNGFFFYFK